MYKKRILIFFLILISLGIAVFITFSGSDVNVSGIMPKLLLLGAVAGVLLVLQFILLPKADSPENDDIEMRIDMVNAKNQMMETLSKEGYILDLSLGSLKEVDRYLNSTVLMENEGRVLFSIGVYVGHVLIENGCGSWVVEHLPTGIEIVVSDGEKKIYPVQIVTKKYHNGKDESLFDYASKMISNK